MEGKVQIRTTRLLLVHDSLEKKCSDKRRFVSFPKSSGQHLLNLLSVTGNLPTDDGIVRPQGKRHVEGIWACDRYRDHAEEVERSKKKYVHDSVMFIWQSQHFLFNW